MTSNNQLICWDVYQSETEYSFSDDSLTANKKTSNEYYGIVGNKYFSAGLNSFAIKVNNPIDDAFWVGVCYSDILLSCVPKKNRKCIIWSGGDTKNDRPGTIRVYGEKFRNQPMFQDNDILGFVVDMQKGDLLCYLNNKKVAEWRGALHGPVICFASFKHVGPSVTLQPAWQPVDDTTLTLNNNLLNSSLDNSCILSIDKDVKNDKFLPFVDGSLLEGGGQVLRVALGLGALLGKPLYIHSIRGKRPKPGLGSQHSTGIKLVADLCRGLVRPNIIQYGGHCEGITEFQLWPGTSGLSIGNFSADIHTAGAITLLIQAVLPCALLTPLKISTNSDLDKKSISITLKGGTNVKFSPSIDYTKYVLAHWLKKFGVNSDNLQIDISNRGYYPKGGGSILMNIAPIKYFNSIDVTDRGTPIKIDGIVFANGVGVKIKKDVVIAIRKNLKERFGTDIKIDIKIANERSGSDENTNSETKTNKTNKNKINNKNIISDYDTSSRTNLTSKERRKINEERAIMLSGTCGCQLWITTSTDCVIAGDSLIEANKKSGSCVISVSEVADNAVNCLYEMWNAGGCVDEHTLDQLIIFMALAKGKSRLLCPGSSSITSQHVETAIYFATLLSGVQFTRKSYDSDGVETKLDLKKPHIIECNGLSLIL
jgi:RNA 3'-terminal phosphate cyclase (ATP)